MEIKKQFLERGCSKPVLTELALSCPSVCFTCLVAEMKRLCAASQALAEALGLKGVVGGGGSSLLLNPEPLCVPGKKRKRLGKE